MPPYLVSDIHAIAAALGDHAALLSGTTVLLTGGTGFLGRYFVALCAYLNDQVLQRPCRLIVCDNLVTSTTPDPALLHGFPFLSHNVIYPIALEEPIDYIIHAAGIASPYYYRKYPIETLEVATVGTKHLLTLGCKTPVKGFLFFSSSEIYGDPDPAHVPTSETYRGNVSCLGPRACYDESKRLGETLCMIFAQQHGLATKIVRPFNIYGPGMQATDYRVLPNFVHCLLTGQSLKIYGTGKQTRTFCYVTDALTGFLKVLLHGQPGEPYNIGNPSPELTMQELATLLQELFGRPSRQELIPHPSSYPADEPQRRCPNIQKVIGAVGYRPTVGLREGLTRFLQWTEQQPDWTACAEPTPTLTSP